MVDAEKGKIGVRWRGCHVVVKRGSGRTTLRRTIQPRRWSKSQIGSHLGVDSDVRACRRIYAAVSIQIRHGENGSHSQHLAQPLVVHKEKCPVLLYRPTHGAAKLIEAKRRRAR